MCQEWGGGAKLGQIFTFIFLAGVLVGDIKNPHFSFHKTVKLEYKKGYIQIH